MKLTNKWLDKWGACSRGREWLEAQKERDGVKIVKKLIAEKDKNCAALQDAIDEWIPETRRLLVIMNKVTACHRHVIVRIIEMANAQIDAEKEIDQLAQPEKITCQNKGNKMRTLDADELKTLVQTEGMDHVDMHDAFPWILNMIEQLALPTEYLGDQEGVNMVSKEFAKTAKQNITLTEQPVEEPIMPMKIIGSMSVGKFVPVQEPKTDAIEAAFQIVFYFIGYVNDTFAKYKLEEYEAIIDRARAQLAALKGRKG